MRAHGLGRLNFYAGLRHARRPHRNGGCGRGSSHRHWCRCRRGGRKAGLGIADMLALAVDAWHPIHHTTGPGAHINAAAAIYILGSAKAGGGKFCGHLGG
jgi:hypothetical protein